ncbi:tRNA (adenine(58)-N(1))-methyltransferase non-catalytic subunit TRM6 [Phlyctochytrium planicorne]|nr:tRNA (adenine(58)-N(1))-methyltransferase non-catalytic subunit TRM6 [Phlyctochytrium planicorne]
MPSSNMKIVQLIPSTTIDLGKFGSFKTDFLIGQPYNAEYEIFGNQEVKLFTNHERIELEHDSDADNSNLLDTQESQKLSHLDIEQLKEASLTGKIDDAVEFLKRFHALPMSAHNLCDFYFTEKPQKISELRVDTLSQMMSLANVNFGSSYLVVDGIKGLLTGAVLEKTVNPRQAGVEKIPFGDSLVVGIGQDSPDIEILKKMNLDIDYETSNFKYLSLPSTSGFINTQLTESWLREYQVGVNASGTHPRMQMPGGGGFILSTLYVEPKPPQT